MRSEEVEAVSVTNSFEKKSSGSRRKLNRDVWSMSKEDKVKISPESLFCSLIHCQ